MLGGERLSCLGGEHIFQKLERARDPGLLQAGCVKCLSPALTLDSLGFKTLEIGNLFLRMSIYGLALLIPGFPDCG